MVKKSKEKSLPSTSLEFNLPKPNEPLPDILPIVISQDCQYLIVGITIEVDPNLNYELA